VFPTRVGVDRTAEREVFAYRVNAALGFDLVPPTEFWDYQGGLWSAMRWQDGCRTGRELGYQLETKVRASDTFQQMRLLDMITGNTDRHDHNWLYDSITGKWWAIDNGMSNPALDADPSQIDWARIPNSIIERMRQASRQDWYEVFEGFDNRMRNALADLVYESSKDREQAGVHSMIVIEVKGVNDDLTERKSLGKIIVRDDGKVIITREWLRSVWERILYYAGGDMSRVPEVAEWYLACQRTYAEVTVK
ncbi:MAG: hypothetical protein K6V36_11585, partial [Anaerolineae bacterium]|nr:hypothetical protein [Anaerolineae bacterium]